jgi:ELWxxDGT repeat protein
MKGGLWRPRFERPGFPPGETKKSPSTEAGDTDAHEKRRHPPGARPLPGSLRFRRNCRGSDDGLRDRLWVSDGTEAGTRLVHCLLGAGSGSWVSQVRAAGGRAFFVAAHETTGPELWVTDGTAAGTGLVRDLRPEPVGSYPSSLTAVDGVLVFAAYDGDSGTELWVSDGTAAGTRRLADVAPGPESSSPAEVTAAGGLLYFSAETAGSGRELWAIERASLLDPR